MNRGLAARFLLAALLGSLPTLGVVTLEWRFGIEFETPLDLGVAVAAITYPFWVKGLGIDGRGSFLAFLIGFSTTLGVISFVTGAANGLTDEAFTTPAYLNILLRGSNPYAVQLTLSYRQYGSLVTSTTYYQYLPLLMFIQIPDLSYKIFSGGCWLAMLWLVRRNFYSTAALAQPFVALMAFNGFNDLVPLLLLTVGFVGWNGQRQRWAQIVALGTKQFANVLVFAYYLVRRDWRNAVLTAAITVVILAPFLVWDWNATLCHAVLYGLPAGCAGQGHLLLLFHIDYGLWPLWFAAIFYAPVIAYLRSSPLRRLRSSARAVRDRIRAGSP